MDANQKDVTTIEGRHIPGFGNGFSAFLGLSEKNTIWIAEVSQTGNAIKTKAVKNAICSWRLLDHAVWNHT